MASALDRVKAGTSRTAGPLSVSTDSVLLLQLSGLWQLLPLLRHGGSKEQMAGAEEANVATGTG